MQGVKDASGLYEVERRAYHAARPGFRIMELQIGPDQKVPCLGGKVSSRPLLRPVVGGALTLFLVCSHIANMWGKADELRLSVIMGLRDGLSLIRGMRRSLTEDEQHKIADAIVVHLEQSNWKIEHRPAREGQGPHIMSK
jgi:hypothetical protein